MDPIQNVVPAMDAATAAEINRTEVEGLAAKEAAEQDTGLISYMQGYAGIFANKLARVIFPNPTLEVMLLEEEESQEAENVQERETNEAEESATKESAGHEESEAYDRKTVYKKGILGAGVFGDDSLADDEVYPDLKEVSPDEVILTEKPSEEIGNSNKEVGNSSEEVGTENTATEEGWIPLVEQRSLLGRITHTCTSAFGNLFTGDNTKYLAAAGAGFAAQEIAKGGIESVFTPICGEEAAKSFAQPFGLLAGAVSAHAVRRVMANNDLQDREQRLDVSNQTVAVTGVVAALPALVTGDVAGAVATGMTAVVAREPKANAQAITRIAVGLVAGAGVANVGTAASALTTALAHQGVRECERKALGDEAVAKADTKEIEVRRKVTQTVAKETFKLLPIVQRIKSCWAKIKAAPTFQKQMLRGLATAVSTIALVAIASAGVYLGVIAGGAAATVSGPLGIALGVSIGVLGVALAEYTSAKLDKIFHKWLDDKFTEQAAANNI